MGRAPCCDKTGLLKKGPWSQEEDEKLLDYIQKYGYGNWRTLPTIAGLQRCGKSCRLRWTNYLRPDIKRGRFSFEEDDTIIHLHSILGNKWSLIAARLPGRTDNEIKNYWNTNIRKRLLRMGIDPVTHSPRLQLLDLSAIINSSMRNNSPTQTTNFPRFSGLMQPRFNPDLLRFAASLFSSHCHTQDFPMQNQMIIGNSQTPHAPLMQTSVGQKVEVFPDLCVDASLDTSFSVTDFQQKNPAGYGMPSAFAGDYVPVFNDGYYSSGDPPFVDPNPSSVTSNIFQSYCSNNLGSQPILSNMSPPPPSSPTPLNSNSTHVNSCNSTEDETESYYNSMLKFEIPDSFDVNDLIM